MSSELPEINAKVEELGDHRRPLKRAIRQGSIALVVITILSLMVWGASQGLEGIWGVLLGAGIGGGFVLGTVVVVLFTAHANPTTTLAIMMGSWLMKIMLVMIILFILKGMDFYSRTALGATMIVALVVVLAVETVAILSTRTSSIGE